MSKLIKTPNWKKKEINKVLYITLVLNFVVAFIKIVVGKQYGYLSLTSSGLESLFDGASNILGLVSIALAFRPADNTHHYGHFKYENIGGILLAILLFYSATQMAFQTFEFFGSTKEKLIFGPIPIISILVSLMMSFGVSYYEGKKGKELKSAILISDSKHTKGDFIISFGVLVSIICSYWKLSWPDLVVGSLISFYLIVLAINVFRENLPDLLDESPEIDKELLVEIEKIENVIDVHNFRARGNLRAVYVDCHLHLNKDLSLLKAHEVGKVVENIIKERLSEEFDSVDVTIHFEPFTPSHKDYSKE